MKHGKYKLYGILVIFIVLFCITAYNIKTQPVETQDDKKTQIMAFAAASLTEVLAELIDSFQMKYPVKALTNMASSGTLARQIEQGANPDVYISASKKWADYLDSSGYFLPGSKTIIAFNELVLVAPATGAHENIAIDSSLNFISLLGSGRLSIGDPAHVPAGRYAKQALEYYGWYGQLEEELLPAKDVRTALMVVEMEESPLGIVYKTDALKSKKVGIIGAFPETSHKHVVYVGGICKHSKEAEDFIAFLNSEEALPVWIKYGFKK